MDNVIKKQNQNDSNWTVFACQFQIVLKCWVKRSGSQTAWILGSAYVPTKVSTCWNNLCKCVEKSENC